MRIVTKITIRLSCVIGLFVLFNEYLIYYLKISQCKWPNLAGERNTRAMILADLHMLGPYNGHWADKLRREWQMHRSFQTALTLHQPALIFILGDLFDEGQLVTDLDFARYVIRFRKLFHVPAGVRIFGAVGNHDIGFHYRMNPFLINRFKRKVYKNPPNALITVNDVNFVLVNSMAMEADGCSLCKSAEKDLQRIAKRLKCARSEKEGNCPNETVTAHASRPILLQHFPTYRESDAECLERDAVPLEKFRETWEVLSKASTDWLAEKLEPRAVFSGHSHQFCRSKTRWNVDEFTISSFSWRNINNPKFLMAEFTAHDHAVAVCEVPHESTVLAIYTYGLLLAGVSVIGFTLISRKPAIELTRKST